MEPAMLRPLRDVVLALVAGLFVTVAVAWAAALSGPERGVERTTEGKPAGGLLRDIPSDMGETRTSTSVTTVHCAGCDYQGRWTTTGTVGYCVISTDRQEVSCLAGWPM